MTKKTETEKVIPLEEFNKFLNKSRELNSVTFFSLTTTYYTGDRFLWKGRIYEIIDVIDGNILSREIPE